MKTLSEAALVVRSIDFWKRNESLAKEISEDPHVLQCLLTISVDPATNGAMKLMQAICVGIAIGMEMEKE